MKTFVFLALVVVVAAVLGVIGVVGPDLVTKIIVIAGFAIIITLVIMVEREIK